MFEKSVQMFARHSSRSLIAFDPRDELMVKTGDENRSSFDVNKAVAKTLTEAICRVRFNKLKKMR